MGRIITKLIKKLVLPTLYIVVTFTLIKADYDLKIQQKELWFMLGEWQHTNIIPDYDLNTWLQNNDMNHNIPTGQLFSYNGVIYVSRDNTYNPQWHGVPEANKNRWAYVITTLEWQQGYVYRKNSVVTHNNKYYISIVADNWNEWGVTVTWAWQEIEPMTNDMFDKFPNTNIIDYATPNMEKVIYK